MKTAITVELTDNARTLIAARTTGEMRRASREEVRDYFTAILEDMANELATEADTAVALFATEPTDGK